MNKLLQQGLTLSIFVFSLTACNKENLINSNATAAIQVINGVIREDIQLKMNGGLNRSGANSSNSQRSFVSYGTGAFYYAERKSISIEVLKNTTTTSLFSNTYDFKDGSIYTLLLAGISPSVESVLIDDSNLPYLNLSTMPNNTDSVINLRFINLSPNSNPLSIKIQGAGSDEISSLTYKGATNFKAYIAKSANFNYKFEIRDGSTLLLTYTFNINTTNRFKNVALLIRGLEGTTSGPNAFTVSAVNYFQ